MIKMKEILNFFDYVFICVSGLSFLELLPIIVTGNASMMFSNIDNGIKIASATVGLIYLSIRIYFFYHKSKGEIKLQHQQIRELEIRNNKTDLENFTFNRIISENVTKDEYEMSKNRIK